MNNRGATLGERLLARSVREPATGCLRWSGSHNDKGYGYISFGGRRYSVHRAAYEQWVGSIPHGLEIDHVWTRGCRFRDCVEPTHLEAVTHQENLSRRAYSTSCPSGHPFSPENTRVLSGRRVCLTCKRERLSAWRALKLMSQCEICGKTILKRNLSRHSRLIHEGQVRVP